MLRNQNGDLLLIQSHGGKPCGSENEAIKNISSALKTAMRERNQCGLNTNFLLTDPEGRTGE